jgi:hypothetical protein
MEGQRSTFFKGMLAGDAHAFALFSIMFKRYFRSSWPVQISGGRGVFRPGWAGPDQCIIVQGEINFEGACVRRRCSHRRHIYFRSVGEQRAMVTGGGCQRRTRVEPAGRRPHRRLCRSHGLWAIGGGGRAECGGVDEAVALRPTVTKAAAPGEVEAESAVAAAEEETVMQVQADDAVRALVEQFVRYR